MQTTKKTSQNLGPGVGSRLLTGALQRHQAQPLDETDGRDLSGQSSERVPPTIPTPACPSFRFRVGVPE